MQLVLVSGLSGSGKSIALRFLEDSGYYCVDNLPATLLLETMDFLAAAGHDRVAVSIDARSAALPALPEHLERMKARGVDCRVLYLEATTPALLRPIVAALPRARLVELPDADHGLDVPKRAGYDPIARAADAVNDFLLALP